LVGSTGTSVAHTLQRHSWEVNPTVRFFVFPARLLAGAEVATQIAPAGRAAFIVDPAL